MIDDTASKIAAIRQDPLNEKLLKTMEEMLVEKVSVAHVDTDENNPAQDIHDVFVPEMELDAFLESIPVVIAMLRKAIKQQAIKEEPKFALSRDARTVAIKTANAWSDFCDYIIHEAFNVGDINDDMTAAQVTRIIRAMKIKPEFHETYLKPNGLEITWNYVEHNLQKDQQFFVTPSIRYTNEDGQSISKALILTPIYYVAWFDFVSSLTEKFEQARQSYSEDKEASGFDLNDSDELILPTNDTV